MSIAAYLRDVNARGGYRPTTKGNERRYARSHQGRRQLVLRNLPLVVSIASKFVGLGLPLADLIQEGNLALLRAAKTFRPRKARFSTYATIRIRGDILRALSFSPTIRVPEEGDEADRPAVFSIAADEGEAIEVPDRPHPGLPPFGLREALEDALSSLSPRERYVIRARYLSTGEPTLAEVARPLRISARRACTIAADAIAKIADCPAMWGWISYDAGRRRRRRRRRARQRRPKSCSGTRGPAGPTSGSLPRPA